MTLLNSKIISQIIIN